MTPDTRATDRDTNALYMARRIMRRNLERARDALTVADNHDLLQAIEVETWAWLHDYEQDTAAAGEHTPA